MFTGLVDDLGVIERVSTTDAGRQIDIRCGYEDLERGESIAVNGVCLTVLEPRRGGFTCAAFAPTIELTTIGTWVAGRQLNLERALRLTDRLGGHFVQGHVDGIGRVEQIDQERDAIFLDLAVPEAISDLMVERGSIAVDGVSLTIQSVPAGLARVALIAHTRTHTTLGALKVGDQVHIEADMLAKHVRKLLAPHTTHDA